MAEAKKLNGWVVLTKLGDRVAELRGHGVLPKTKPLEVFKTIERLNDEHQIGFVCVHFMEADSLKLASRIAKEVRHFSAHHFVEPDAAKSDLFAIKLR